MDGIKRIGSRDLEMVPYKNEDGDLRYREIIESDKVSSLVMYYLKACADWEKGIDHFVTMHPKLYRQYDKTRENFHIWLARKLFNAFL